MQLINGVLVNIQPVNQLVLSFVILSNCLRVSHMTFSIIVSGPFFFFFFKQLPDCLCNFHPSILQSVTLATTGCNNAEDYQQLCIRPQWLIAIIMGYSTNSIILYSIKTLMKKKTLRLMFEVSLQRRPLCMAMMDWSVQWNGVECKFTDMSQSFSHCSAVLSSAYRVTGIVMLHQGTALVEDGS